ncbi:MAG: TonB-dependent receptor plug domain-containing protein, partial [Tunicatimonas sp.]|uniref:TonB-dependent receptor plug domain-containing protein n=1 Tax=Tunicatimonas sp. TaxID=1940096 RepID=UPI003C778E5A
MDNQVLHFLKILLCVTLLLVFERAAGQQIAIAQKSQVAKPSSSSQDTQEELSEALKLIGLKHQVRFSFDGEVVKDKYVEKSQIPGKNLGETLITVLTPLQLRYEKIDEVHYVITAISAKKREVEKLNKKKLDIKKPTPYQKDASFQLNTVAKKNALTAIEKTISGQIVDLSTNEPIPGVNILAKGTTTGTVTDISGNYRLTVADAVTTLVFSSIGFETVEETINGRSVINLSLAPDIQSLSEVVVVGYGTQKKSDIVGSVASVSAERLEQNANPNIFQALQGAAPGLNITRGTGDPGTNGSIQIRGINSISASNSPLIVVDGIPFAGNIRDINPNDISSVEILKDASAAAIYGSRAASGVILITTKLGTTRGTTIEFNASWSIQNEAVEY